MVSDHFNEIARNLPIKSEINLTANRKSRGISDKANRTAFHATC